MTSTDDTPITPRARFTWCAVLLLTTLAPYVYCWLRVHGREFLWILPPSPGDSLAYFAWERQARNGALLFSMKYTSLPHAPFLFQPFFLIVGWFSRLTQLSLPLANLLAKAAGTVLFVHVWFRFARAFRLGRAQTTYATAMMAFASGLGGYLIFAAPELGRLSADLWFVDLNTYRCLLWNSLFPYSLALILEITLQAELALSDRPGAHAVRAGLYMAALALVHPYQVPMLGVYCVLRWVLGLRRAAWRPAWIFGLICLGAAGYLLAMERGQPLLARHATHGQMPSPPVLQVLSGLGLPLLVAGVGMFLRSSRRTGLILWFLLSLFGAYVPSWFQRKLFFGLHPVVCAMAGLALGTLQERWARPGRTRLIAAAGVVLVALTSFSNLLLVRSQVGQVLEPTLSNPYAVDADLWRSLEYLREHTQPREVVLANPEVSALIPAVSGNTAVWGHWAQSVDTEQRMTSLRRIFSPSSGLNDEQRSAEFWSIGESYLLVDPWVRRNFLTPGARWLPGELESLSRNGEFELYRRLPPR